jgi:L-serine kinase (ATP) / ParB family transcriptional regulator, heme-responsive regulator
VLRVFDVSQVLLHEEPDPERVQRLVRALRRDGVLRNPPIVTSIPAGAAREFPAGRDDQVVVLDGANRVTALREIGVVHIAAQMVDYEAPEVSVSSWTHYVIEDGESLRERIPAGLGIGLVPVVGPEEADRRLRRGDGMAALLDAVGAAVVGPGIDPVINATSLSGLVGLYLGRSQIYRIDRVESWDIAALRQDYGRGTVVIFPPFEKGAVLRLATGGARLPAGITRHVIPGRALRLNVPLPWLQSEESAATKQARLDEAVAARWRDHGVRYYAEATYLFDE